MKNLRKLIIPTLAAMALLPACSRREARLDASFPEQYEGSRVELMAYADSTVIAVDTIRNGKAGFITVESDTLRFPLLANLNIDGRTRAYYVMEPGEAVLVADSMRVARGGELNGKLRRYFEQLDSVEALDDMALYTDFARRVYTRERESPIGLYFGVEYIRFADPLKIDSLMATASDDLRNSRRSAPYLRYASLRKKTAAGQPYADLKGEDADGGDTALSRYVAPGKYTLVDFMASWCPYCIADFPKLKKLSDEYASKGLDIVSVAVRDKAGDTKEAVRSHAMTWPVIYNTGKTPYDVYGFAGIPHYILIGPDGRILSRSESLKAVTAALKAATD